MCARMNYPLFREKSHPENSKKFTAKMANKIREYSVKELKELNEEEKQLFAAIENENVEEVEKLLEAAKVRINCLDHNGMSPLDQASFKGNQDLVEIFLARGANADNRAHDQGYTALMFAALAGKPRICQMLLDAGANPQAINMIGKTAGELAAFVGQHECVSVISSHIGIEDVDRILHPRGPDSDPQYPRTFVEFIHQLTRTHSFHPVKLVLEIATGNGVIWEHRKKAIWTVDRLFERQLRSKQPNEVQSLKLWLVLHTLRQLLKYVEERKVEKAGELDEQKLALNFARMLLNDRPENLVRQNEEQFIRQAIAAFPYKQSMLWQALSKQFAQIPFGHPPPAFTVLCHSLLGPRFVQTAHFCRTCALPSAQKRCKNCKLFYCSVECQRFDWQIHKKCCEELKRRREEQENEAENDSGNIVLQG